MTDDPAPFADADDVLDRWPGRSFSEAEEAVANTLCEDASDKIRERWPDVDARLDLPATNPRRLAARTLTRIVCGIVKRAMNTGDADGVSQETEAAGPFTLGRTYFNPNGDLYFTAEDVRTLDGPATSGRAFAVDLSSNVPPPSYPPRGYGW